MRTSGQQKAQFRLRSLVLADQNNWSGLQIKEYRQKPHAKLRFPICGVDWNYFLYMYRSRHVKRKLFLLHCVATLEIRTTNPTQKRCLFSRQFEGAKSSHLPPPTTMEWQRARLANIVALQETAMTAPSCSARTPIAFNQASFG
jgi:hypothetical protein